MSATTSSSYRSNIFKSPTPQSPDPARATSFRWWTKTKRLVTSSHTVRIWFRGIEMVWPKAFLSNLFHPGKKDFFRHRSHEPIKLNVISNSYCAFCSRSFLRLRASRVFAHKLPNKYVFVVWHEMQIYNIYMIPNNMISLWDYEMQKARQGCLLGSAQQVTAWVPTVSGWIHYLLPCFPCFPLPNSKYAKITEMVHKLINGWSHLTHSNKTNDNKWFIVSTLAPTTMWHPFEPVPHRNVLSL